MADTIVTDSRWTPEQRWSGIIARAESACAERFPHEMKDREISVLLCGDAEMRTLNRRWRGLDKPTNVLSFPSADGPAAHRPLGDIAISWETVVRESEQEAKPVEHHVTHLMIHGVLHLLGFDHETSGEAEEMEAEERRILSGLGIGDPYLEPDRRPALAERSDAP